MVPSRWKFDHFQPCDPSNVSADHVTFITVFFAVSLEAFLWGAGTAIGELPPYFVARAASMAGGQSEELEEMLEEAKKDKSWMN
jgi:hypothetical protein